MTDNATLIQLLAEYQENKSDILFNKFYKLLLLNACKITASMQKNKREKQDVETIAMDACNRFCEKILYGSIYTYVDGTTRQNPIKVIRSNLIAELSNEIKKVLFPSKLSDREGSYDLEIADSSYEVDYDKAVSEDSYQDGYFFYDDDDDEEDNKPT